MIQKYGKTFKDGYGWASSALAPKKASFSAIEEAVDFSHWRPYYKMASHQVHAESIGLSKKLSLSGYTHPIRLTGPSARGLADPGQSATLSLLQLSILLLTRQTNADRLVLSTVLSKLSDELLETFITIHRSEHP